jgi:septal ring factor EnvC (AmiA/AmiB activator)
LNLFEQVDPGPAPETFGAYKKSGEANNGVLAMIDLLQADLLKEIQTMEVDEKNAQEEYEELMQVSAEKRAADSKAITDKSAAKAEMEAALAKENTDHMSKINELMATAETLAGVHGECDWNLENYEPRKAAREAEVESLKKATAILNGADFSLVQRKSKRLLLSVEA